MNHYIYEITNLVNGKKYIGKRSCNCPIEEDAYMGSGKLLKKAIKKYGKENFKKDILYICENESHAYAKEYIEILKVRTIRNWDEYYNIALGGRGGIQGISSRKGVKLTEETKKKIKDNHKRPFLGKSLTEETKKKISETKKGDKNPMYGTKAPNSKRVILINTMKEFETLKEACVFIGLKNSSNIMMCCKGERKSAGKINGEPAKWMYYEDYLKIIK